MLMFVRINVDSEDIITQKKHLIFRIFSLVHWKISLLITMKKLCVLICLHTFCTGLIDAFSSCEAAWILNYRFRAVNCFAVNAQIISPFISFSSYFYFILLALAQVLSTFYWPLPLVLCCRSDGNPGCQLVFLVSVFRDCWEGQGFQTKTEDEGGYRRGSALEEGPTFTSRWKTVCECVCLCMCASVNPQPRPHTALCVIFIHIKRSEDTYVASDRRGRPPPPYLFLRVCQGGPRWVWYCCA